MRLAQLDRAFGYGPKGRGFESSNARAENLVKSRENEKHSELSGCFFRGMVNIWLTFNFFMHFWLTDHQAQLLPAHPFSVKHAVQRKSIDNRSKKEYGVP